MDLFPDCLWHQENLGFDLADSRPQGIVAIVQKEEEQSCRIYLGKYL